MLSPDAAAIVRATVPAVTAHGVEITSTFYSNMFTAHPELLGLFNRGNQANGDQRQALAASVVAYAEHLLGERDAPFEPVMARIAHKHASLGVRPTQYTIVGKHLLGAVGEVLGDAVTDEVRGAWEEVYWLFATSLIEAEARLTADAGIDPGRHWRPWRVVDRVDEAEDVVSFALRPHDERPVPWFTPGQYVSVAVDVPGVGRQPRQYTISNAPGQDVLRITVRRVRGVGGAPDGLVSSHLHDDVAPGDLLHLAPPFGDVTLDADTAPLLCISAGVGITPMAAMVEHLARTAPWRRVVVAHADRSPATHALRDDITAAGRRLQSFEQRTWYEDPAGAQVDPNVRTGFLDVDDLPVPARARVYMCGPLPFMRAVRHGLRARGVPNERISYEVFGPDLWAQAPETAPSTFPS